MYRLDEGIDRIHASLYRRFDVQPGAADRFIDGEVKGDPSPAPNLDVCRIWNYGEPITEAEYRFMLADADWCRTYQPDAPQANPRRPVERAQAPLV